jgi:hypothetical protein
MRFATVVVVASFAMSTAHAANTHEGDGRAAWGPPLPKKCAFTTRSKRSSARGRGS